jgi:hypothetical protein
MDGLTLFLLLVLILTLIGCGILYYQEHSHRS